MPLILKRNSFSNKDPIVQTAILFAQFLFIHPFMDGNGRVARILIPLYLVKKKILSKPYLFMSGNYSIFPKKGTGKVRSPSF